MASYTLTRNLRLRLDSTLSANSRYNLERIDLLASTFSIDSNENARVRARGNIEFQPNSSALGGSGSGGSVSFGTAGSPLTSLAIHASAISLGTLGDVLTEMGIQTVTNKTLDFSQNTFLNFPGASGIEGFASTWVTADGLTKSVVHNLNSPSISVAIIDLTDNAVSGIDNTTVIDNNTVQLTASELPGANGWRVVVFAV